MTCDFRSVDLHSLFRAANDPATSPLLLAQLTQHENAVVRNAVAHNPSTPANAIELLKRDPEVDFPEP
jgi:hypothetical protein